jgi:flagella basal body P-ring formation protein FlgA
MTSSARLALLLAGAAAPLAPAAAQVPAPLAAAVRASLAAQWAADSASVRLDWGAVPTAAALTPATPFSVLGRGTDGWYVALFRPPAGSPVAVKLRAGTMDTLTVAARPLTANTTLAAGEPLTASTALPPQMVKAGDAVHLEWRRSGIVVGLEGVALGSGALGQTVRVRLPERGGQRSGRVVGPDAVRLDS